MDNLNKTTFNSPIDGIITSLRVEEGETAIIGTMNNPGTVLMTIADLSVMEVEVEVDETDVVGVKLSARRPTSASTPCRKRSLKARSPRSAAPPS